MSYYYNHLSKDVIRYDYFNLSDAQIFKDHEPVIWKIPACEDNEGETISTNE